MASATWSACFCMERRGERQRGRHVAPGRGAHQQVAGHAVDHLRHADGRDRLVDRQRRAAAVSAARSGATVQEITWITTGFAIATVLVMPLTAFLGRLFGQKRVYLACLALFVVGSLLCGTRGDAALARVLPRHPGLGAGALQPTEQAILRQTFPPKEQGMAMALFAMAVMVGPGHRPDARRLHRRQLPLVVDLLHQRAGRHARPLHGRAASCTKTGGSARANRALAPSSSASTWTGRASPSCASGLAALQYLLEEGQPQRLVRLAR